MWVLIDNYDSFSNILHLYLQQIQECLIFRNDAITIEELKQLNPSRIILSPGPKTPHEAGICLDIIEHFHASTPILGICLGHQALGIYFGAELVRSSYPQHGKVSCVDHTQHPLFKGIDTRFEVMRYHSLELKINSDSPLKSIAVSKFDNAIMAIAHETFPVIGIQFHPESIGTKLGMQLLENWSELKF